MVSAMDFLPPVESLSAKYVEIQNISFEIEQRATAAQKANLIKEYRSLCRGFGFSDKNPDGSASADFGKCVQDMYFKAEELKIKERAENKRIENEKLVADERLKIEAKRARQADENERQMIAAAKHSNRIAAARASQERRNLIIEKSFADTRSLTERFSNSSTNTQFKRHCTKSITGIPNMGC